MPSKLDKETLLGKGGQEDHSDIETTGSWDLTIINPPEILAFPAIIDPSTISTRTFHEDQLETNFALRDYIQRKMRVQLRYGS
jgi:hypothetical protein